MRELHLIFLRDTFSQVKYIFENKLALMWNQSWLCETKADCQADKEYTVQKVKFDNVINTSPRDPPPPLQDVFAAQHLPFSKTHYRPKKAIFIKSTAIISGFTMITSLLKKTTTFWDTKIIVKLLYVKARWRVFVMAAKW